MQAKSEATISELQSKNMVPEKSIGALIVSALEEATSLGAWTKEVYRCISTMLVEELTQDTQLQFGTVKKAIHFVLEQGSASTTSNLKFAKTKDDGIFKLEALCQHLQSDVAFIQQQCSDISHTSEFNRGSAPWVVRAQEVRDRKAEDVNTSDQLRRTKVELQESIAASSERDKKLEEQSIKIDLLEARHRETRNQAGTLHKLEANLEAAVRARNKIATELDSLATQHKQLQQQHDDGRNELEGLRKRPGIGDIDSDHSRGSAPPALISQFQAESASLLEKIANLEAGVSFLKMENHHLRIPPNAVTEVSRQHAWLDPSALKKNKPKARILRLKGDGFGPLHDLMELSKEMQPLMLSAGEDRTKTSTWQARATTTEYQIALQREKLERWTQSMRDVQPQGNRGIGRPITSNFYQLPNMFDRKDDRKVDIEIVGSPC